MRDLALAVVLVALLAMAVARPFVGVLMWSWISFMNPHREVWGFAGTMPWAMMAFAATLLGCIIAREPKKFPINAFTLLLCAFAIAITVTSFHALAPPEAVWAKWDRTVKMLAGLLLTASLLSNRWRIHALVWLFVISLGFYGVKGGIFTIITGGGFIVLGPPDSMIFDRNHLSVALLVAMPMMNYLRQTSRHAVTRWGLVLTMICTLFAVVGSQSRGALIALAATAFTLWTRSHGKIVSGIAILLVGAVALNFMPDSWVERMETIQTYDQDASANARFRIWTVALMLAQLRPLVGTGFVGTHFRQVVDLVAPGDNLAAVHSIWLEVIAEHGLPTFAIWLAMLLTGVFYSLSIVQMTRNRPELRWAHDLARMSQVSFVAYCTGGSFLSLSYWDGFWTLAVILGAARVLVAKASEAPRRVAKATRFASLASLYREADRCPGPGGTAVRTSA